MKFFIKDGIYLRKKDLKNPNKIIEGYYITKTGTIFCKNVKIEKELNKLYFKILLAKDSIESIIYKLKIWYELSNVDFILFRQLVYDSPEIADFLETSVRIKFVKSLILFLQTFEHFDPIFKERLKDLIKYYFDIFKEQSKELKSILSVKDLRKEQLFAAEEYLNLCINDDNQKWFNNRKDVSSREEEIERIVDLLNNVEIPLTERKTEQEEKQEELLRDARTWLLLRYDLKKSSEIQFKDSKLKRIFAKGLPEFIAAIALISFIFDFSFLNIYHFKTNIFLVLFYLLLTVVGITILINIKPERNQIQILLPRLTAGIVVGYFALMTDEAWNGVFSFYFSHSSKIILFLRIFVPLVLVYFYILAEMSNLKGINHIRTKAIRMLVRGYSYSIIIGIIFSDFFGHNLYHRMIRDEYFPASPINGIFGNIYPIPILLMAPLALFIGVFFQLLWEDKALTEKI